ncbi:DUF3347 domain-containing protein [Flavimarina sp. Hel_I_48]|uniref:DUF3347 domain-containing protein n=1 Tax=Flavimarina sp. Hel_I_48 TaxID=1392488 RepID=UPI0006915F9D|nr:DUF3347 domain-containing protein [Flavimarina sp. Hel_I_48]
MKKILVYSLAAFLMACGENKSENKAQEQLIEVDTMAQKKELNKHVSAERSAVIDDELASSVYDQYNKIKTALVNSDAKTAKMVAVELLKSTGPELESTGLRESISIMANTQDIEEQRKSFSAFTAVVKNMVEGKISSGTIYYDYCPMAFNGKGAYWLANEEQIQNPYFGDKMLNCGTVEGKLE